MSKKSLKIDDEIETEEHDGKGIMCTAKLELPMVIEFDFIIEMHQLHSLYLHVSVLKVVYFLAGKIQLFSHLKFNALNLLKTCFLLVWLNSACHRNFILIRIPLELCNKSALTPIPSK